MTSTIKSMTAFARCSDHNEWGAFTWEIRAVNHRYLDLNFRLPEIFSALEMGIREILRGHLERGRIDCYLRYQITHVANRQLQIDENLVSQLIENANQVGQKLSGSVAIDPMAILAWPDVLQKKEIDVQPVNEAILSLLKKTAQELVTAREREGLALRLVIEKTIQTIVLEVIKIKQRLPVMLDTERQKILTKFAEIKAELDGNRLEQEMVLFAHKVDITEELDRLEIHLQDMRRILANGGGVGKKLDFLVQELNRETNTMASKSADVEITKSAIDIKVFLEQIREQVQNLE